MGHGRPCLSALAVSLLVSGTALQSHEADRSLHASSTDGGADHFAKPAGNGPRRHRPVPGNRPACPRVGRGQGTRPDYPPTGRRGHPPQRPCAPEACGSDHAASRHRAGVGVRDQGDRGATSRCRASMREPSSSSRKRRSPSSMRKNCRPWWRTKSGTSTSGRNVNVPSKSVTAAVSKIWSSCAMASPS